MLASVIKNKQTQLLTEMTFMVTRGWILLNISDYLPCPIAPPAGLSFRGKYLTISNRYPFNLLQIFNSQRGYVLMTLVILSCQQQVKVVTHPVKYLNIGLWIDTRIFNVPRGCMLKSLVIAYPLTPWGSLRQQLSDELPWNLVQIFMLPSG